MYLFQRLTPQTELYSLREILFRHVGLSRNLSKYPAVVDDGPNEFLPPFSRECEFAILVGDTAERSPEGRFNFAKLAGSSRKICIATLEAASVVFLTLVLILECYSDVRFLIPIVPTKISKRYIRAIYAHANNLQLLFANAIINS